MGRYINEIPKNQIGRFINFYRFCAKTINDKKLVDNYYLLLSIKDLRNATAHNH